MENPIKMDDLGVPLFSETSIYYTDYTIHLDLSLHPLGEEGGFYPNSEPINQSIYQSINQSINQSNAGSIQPTYENVPNDVFS